MIMSNFAQDVVKEPLKIQTGCGTFVFRKRWGRIDWRSIASVDIDQLSREMDLQALQQNIVNITFCSVEMEDFQKLDPNFLKLFRLAQLIIEYLLHSQQYLTEQNALQEKKLQRAHLELTQVQGELHSISEELKIVKKQSRKRRKVIQAYQDMINAGATGLHTCSVCSREFISAEYLQSHICRRHPEYQSHVQMKTSSVNHEELEKKLVDNMTEQLQAAETELRMKMERKEREALDIQSKQMEEWKEHQKQLFEDEMRQLQEPILSQLKEVQQEKAQLEKELLQTQATELHVGNTVKKQSHLGHLEGSKELCVSDTKCQAESTKAEVAHLKQQLDSQVQGVQATLKSHERKLQKKMKTLLSSYQDQLSTSMVKVDLLERSMAKPIYNSEEQERGLHVYQPATQCQQSSTPQVPSAPLKSKGDDTCSLMQSESSDNISQSESSSNIEYKDETDFPDHDTHVLQRSKTHHHHVMESIKTETMGIFHDALQQRGITKYTRGLSDVQLEMKLGALKQERQKRIQTHYNFLEHRRTLAEEIKASTQMIKSNPSKPVPHKISLNGGSASSSKPPKPNCAPNGQYFVSNPGTNSLSTSSLSSLSVYSTDDSEEKDVHIPTYQKPDAVLTSCNDVSPGIPETCYVDEHFHQTNATEVSGDSPWDSEDDLSIEKLAAPQDVTGRVSSTPFKQEGYY